MKTAISLIVLLLLVRSSAADVYKCPDGKGGIRYQNMLCTGETILLFESVGTASLLFESRPLPDTMRPVPPPPPASRSFQYEEAQPIDMRQYDQLHIGMSADQVRALVGTPARVIGPRRIMTPVRAGSGIVMVESLLTAWRYPGTRQTWSTTLDFANGVLVDKRREP